MKLRRLMQNCPLRQSLPKGSIVRHSKIDAAMTLWVKSGTSEGSRCGRNRFQSGCKSVAKCRRTCLRPSPTGCWRIPRNYTGAFA